MIVNEYKRICFLVEVRPPSSLRILEDNKEFSDAITNSEYK